MVMLFDSLAQPPTIRDASHVHACCLLRTVVDSVGIHLAEAILLSQEVAVAQGDDEAIGVHHGDISVTHRSPLLALAQTVLSL